MNLREALRDTWPFKAALDGLSDKLQEKVLKELEAKLAEKEKRG